MTPKIIKKEELSKLLVSLQGEFEIIGPKRIGTKGLFYEPIENLEDLYLGPGITVEPMKKFFLKPAEDIAGSDALVENKRIIVGVSPCEARGLALLDKVFDSEYKDKFYINNRQRTTILGLSCIAPDEHCFCTSLGGDPSDPRGMDALLFDHKDSFVVEVITGKGKQLFDALGKELEGNEKNQWQQNKEKKKELIKKKINLPEDMAAIFENDYWKEASAACLSCGICTYLCPTCHCFDLVDDQRKKLRCYDSCAFSDFTLETSGHNPRPTKKERYRQRVFHKFDYFKKNFGENLCVGCGRCIRSCPVKIDISEVIKNAPL